jgi:hypothetical protein
MLGALAAVLSAALAVLAACEPKPSSENLPLTARAAGKRLEDIAAGNISGKIGETQFRAVDVKVRVETMAGRERVDLLVSSERLDHCGLPDQAHGARVWVRWKGTVPTDGTPQRLEPGQHSSMSVNYELFEHGDWVAHSGGAALVSITKAFGGYNGRLWICFDDGRDSCVTGTFSGTECRSELDVDDSVWGAGRAETQTPTKRPE